MIFCGIFDGHGPWGHLVAKRVRKSVPTSLLCNWQESIASTSLDLDPKIEVDRNLHRFNIWKQSYLKTYAAVDQELKHHPRIDSFHSGTTALTMVKQVLRNLPYHSFFPHGIDFKFDVGFHQPCLSFCLFDGYVRFAN